MADVSKIGANGIEYDVCDTAARLGVQTANSNISSLRDDLTNDEADIADLQSNMTTAQSNISALQTQVGNMQTVSGVGYCKMADGTLILRGTTTFTSGSMAAYGSIYISSATITLPQSPKFVSADYTITGSFKAGTGAEFAFGQKSTSTTQASVRIWDLVQRDFSRESLVVRWVAIGRWK